MKAPSSYHWGRYAVTFASLAFALLLATTAGNSSWAGSGALPPDVRADIDAAFRASEAAKANAALSAGIANTAASPEIVNRTRARAEEAALVEAVIRGIARHPYAVSAIVRAAVEQAPAYRGEVTHRAKIAFPGFASQIASAAGIPFRPAATPPALVSPSAPATARTTRVGAAAEDELVDCAQLITPDQRLECYDTLAIGFTRQSRTVRADIGTRETTVSKLPAADRPRTEPARRLRVQFAVGYGQGRQDGTFKLNINGNRIEADVNSLLGGSGYNLNVAVWLDSVLFDQFAFGIEYLRLKRSSKATFIAPDGIEIFVEPISGVAQLELAAHIFFINVAWFPHRSPRAQPFVGLGLGGGFGTFEFDGNTGSPLFTAAGSDQSKFEFGVGQIFAGVDYDITDRFYLNLTTRIAGGAGTTQQYIDLSVQLGTGIRF